jgi:methyl-accepting chemotaxis protein
MAILFNIAVILIAVCAVLTTAILFWVARSLIDGSTSLKKLLETVSENVERTVAELRKSIEDINEITEKAGGQMDRVEDIVKDVRHAAGDARSILHATDQTVVPIVSNMKSVSAGLMKAVETWNDMGERRAGCEGGSEAARKGSDERD